MTGGEQCLMRCQDSAGDDDKHSGRHDSKGNTPAGEEGEGGEEGGEVGGERIRWRRRRRWCWCWWCSGGVGGWKLCGKKVEKTHINTLMQVFGFSLEVRTLHKRKVRRSLVFVRQRYEQHVVYKW